MKLSQLDQLISLNCQRHAICDDLRALEEDDKFIAKIRGEYVDADLLAVARPVMRVELMARLAQVSRKIRALGVEIDVAARAGPDTEMAAAGV